MKRLGLVVIACSVAMGFNSFADYDEAYSAVVVENGSNFSRNDGEYSGFLIEREFTIDGVRVTGLGVTSSDVVIYKGNIYLVKRGSIQTNTSHHGHEFGDDGKLINILASDTIYTYQYETLMETGSFTFSSQEECKLFVLKLIANNAGSQAGLSSEVMDDGTYRLSSNQVVPTGDVYNNYVDLLSIKYTGMKAVDAATALTKEIATEQGYSTEKANASLDEFIESGKGTSYHQNRLCVDVLKRLGFDAEMIRGTAVGVPISYSWYRVKDEVGVWHYYDSTCYLVFGETRLDISPEMYLVEYTQETLDN